MFAASLSQMHQNTLRIALAIRYFWSEKGVFGQFSTVEAVIEESRNKIETEFEYIEKANDRIDGLR